MVWLATRKAGLANIERRCVVKTLRANDDPEYERRFVDEVRLLSLLSHRNICAVIDAGCFEGQYWLAMEHIEGFDLKKLSSLTAETGQALEHGVVVYLVSEVLEALDAAHRMRHPKTGEPLRVVHRDVSPQNVMLGFDGQVKLIDFGLASSTQKVERTATGVVMGKLAYMAPEQARGEAVNDRVDQFAMGVMLYELLANERYYEGLTTEQTWRKSGLGDHEPRRLATLPAELQTIVRQATAPRSTDRFPSCAAMAEALAAWAKKSGATAQAMDARQALRRLMDASARQGEIATIPARVTSLEGRNPAVDVAPPPREKTRTFRLSELDPEESGVTVSQAVVSRTDVGPLTTLGADPGLESPAPTPAPIDVEASRTTRVPRPRPESPVRVVDAAVAAAPPTNRRKYAALAALVVVLVVAALGLGRFLLVEDTSAGRVVDEGAAAGRDETNAATETAPAAKNDPAKTEITNDTTTATTTSAGATTTTSASTEKANSATIDAATEPSATTAKLAATTPTTTTPTTTTPTTTTPTTTTPTTTATTGAVDTTKTTPTKPTKTTGLSNGSSTETTQPSTRTKPKTPSRSLPDWPESGSVFAQSKLLGTHCKDVPCTAAVQKKLGAGGPSPQELARSLRSCYETCRQTPP